MGYRNNCFTRILFAAAWAVLLTSAWAAQTAGSDRVVVIPVANMYFEATENSNVVSQAIIGSNVVTLEVRGNWARVRTADQYAGWMPGDTLRKLGESGAYARSEPVVQVEALFANLYSVTDVTSHKPVLTVPFESRLEVVAEGKGDDAGWAQVRLPDQRTAWIQNGDVNRNSQPLTIAQSIALAKRFLGLPYLWGGRSSYGYDCSGFTQMLVRSRGINMPRDADLQAAWQGAEAVDRKGLRAGDLLFFGPSADSITHTAMYIGEGEFIHSTTHSHPVVQISRLDDEPWTRLLVACRRVK
jgi:gamma-D-glutamyl-L-lysine dipeptidyl-peptidase